MLVQMGRAMRALFFPRACLTCERLLEESWPEVACATCLGRIRQLPRDGCPRCGHPASRGPGCHACLAFDDRIAAARSWCWADDAVARQLLHHLKYNGWPAVATAMGRRMAGLVPDDVPAPTRVLVPVPLTAARRRRRGYNQAELLAGRIAQLWRCTIIPDALVRVREAPSQTQLTRMERFANVASAFAVNTARRPALEGRCCVLVDDVLTTGATLNACAASLRSAGIVNLSCVTFGRARDPSA